MDIFEKFPKITYETLPSRDIMFKIGLVRSLLEKYQIYYEYLVKDGERPDMIAHDYYGDSGYEWLVCLPNNIMDIHTDWVMEYDVFYRYIITTYGSIASAKTTIHHYAYTGVGGNTDVSLYRRTWPMSANTFSELSVDDQAGWTPVYVYDYEDTLNENKRAINLISNVYLNQINREVQELVNA